MPVIDAVLPVILEQFCTFVTTESQLVTGVGGDVKWLQEELQSMNSLLRAASSCAEEENCDPKWIDQIRDVVHEAEDVTETFGLLGSRPHRRYSISYLVAQIKIRYGVGLKIKNIRTNLADISRRKSQYNVPEAAGTVDDSSELLVKRLASSPLICDGILVGADEHLALIMSQTLEIVEDLYVISVLGMGGIGKTTIVKHIYNNTIVKKHFDRSAWIYVSQSVSNRQILSRMLIGLMEIPTAEAAIADDMSLQEKLLTGLDNKRYLLVLDDMWNKKLWDVVKLALPKGKHGSKVIITTRNLEIASLATKTSNTHHIHPLSDDQSWKLFCMKAPGVGEPPEELTGVKKQIVEKCAGLPLAVITLREMLSRKDRTQAELNDVFKENPMSFDSIDESIRQVLLLSYKDLSYPLKQCFLYLAAFPPNFEFSRKRVVQLLMAEGFINQEQGKQPLEDVAERYLMDLISRNILQISKRSTSGQVKAYRVHDLIHQLAISLSEKEKLITIYRNPDSSLQRNTRRVSIQDELYGKLKLHKLRSILVFKNINSKFYHLIRELFKTNRMLRVLDLEESGIRKLPNEIGNTLIHLRYLNVKGTQIDSLPKSIENLFKLQTLDIRRTQIRKVTLMMSGLKQLQHLQMGDVDQSILISPGLDCLVRLQVLTGIQATGSVIKEIDSMCQLRKLTVEVKQVTILKIMCPSINNMKALLSLSIICKEFGQMDLTALVPPPLLQKLHLAGCLDKLPSWIINAHNLVKVRLGFSQLREDPMPPLGVLPNLVFLQLYDAAYQGKIMRCISNGFSKLKIVILTQLDELENWEIEVGALPSIQEVWIMSCTHLNMIPTGFQFLKSMMKLRVVHMPLDFQMRFLTQEGVDFPKVQHIPAIQVLN